MNKLRFWVSFLLILIFITLINRFVFDYKVYMSFGKIKKNYIDLALVLITGFLGFIYFYRPRFVFLKFFWMFIYGGSAFFLFAIAIIDNYIWSISTIDGKHRFSTLKGLLISPLLFIIFSVFDIVLNKSKKPS